MFGGILDWTATWFVVIGSFALLFVLLRFFCRAPIQGIDFPAAQTHAPLLDSDNPYAASPSWIVPNTRPWEILRDRCRRLRVCAAIAIAVAAGALPIALFGRDLIRVSTPVALVCGLSAALPLECATRNKMLSFARQSLLARDVPLEHLNDDLFIGAAGSPASERICSCSEKLGFLHLGPQECTLHLHDVDVTIPRQHMLGLTTLPPKGDTLAAFGVRVVELVWQPADQAAPSKVYLIAWGGETAFTIKSATERLYERLLAWKSSPSLAQSLPPPLPLPPNESA